MADGLGMPKPDHAILQSMGEGTMTNGARYARERIVRALVQAQVPEAIQDIILHHHDRAVDSAARHGYEQAVAIGLTGAASSLLGGGKKILPAATKETTKKSTSPAPSPSSPTALTVGAGSVESDEQKLATEIAAATEEAIVAKWSALPVPDGHEALTSVLEEAINQSANGKGLERHADGRPFHDLPILREALIIAAPLWWSR